jgi:hypothetical protein
MIDPLSLVRKGLVSDMEQGDQSAWAVDVRSKDQSIGRTIRFLLYLAECNGRKAGTMRNLNIKSDEAYELDTSIYPSSFPRRRESMNTDVSRNGGNPSVLFCLICVHGFPPSRE